MADTTRFVVRRQSSPAEGYTSNMAFRIGEPETTMGRTAPAKRRVPREPRHAAFGTEPVDIVIGDDFASPFISGLSFPGLSANNTIDDGAVNLIVRPAGNPGAFLAQTEIDIEQGNLQPAFLVGLPGLPQTVMLSHDRRRLASHARVQLFQGAARFQAMDIYLVADDADIALTGATYPSALFGSGTGYTAVEAGTYHLVFTQPGTKNIVGGPFRVELELARNYSIVIVDAQDIASADMLFFDDMPE